MTFGNKLKKLRTDNNMTQQELADKIFVTRTAVSKWETDNGYPSIETLKALSNLFKVSIDDLISDADMQSKKLLDEKHARKCYYVAIAFLCLTVLCSLLTYFFKQPYFYVGSSLGIAGYLVFGILSKPKYKRLSLGKMLIPYFISRIVVFIVVVGIMIYTLINS